MATMSRTFESEFIDICPECKKTNSSSSIAVCTISSSVWLVVVDGAMA